MAADGICFAGVRFGVVDPSIHDPLLDVDVWSNHTLSPPKYPGSESHILLSACEEGKVAKEKGSRGAFTKALLVVLQGGTHTTEMSYSDILDRMAPLLG